MNTTSYWTWFASFFFILFLGGCDTPNSYYDCSKIDPTFMVESLVACDVHSPLSNCKETLRVLLCEHKVIKDES